MLDIKGFMFFFTPNTTLLSLMSRCAWLSHAWTLAGGRGHRHHSIRRHSILCLRRDIWRWWSKALQSSCLTPLSCHFTWQDCKQNSLEIETHLLSHSQKMESCIRRNILILPWHRTTRCKRQVSDIQWSKCNGRGQTSQDCRPESRDANHKSLASLGNCTSGRREPCLLHHGTRQRRNGP